MNTQTTQTESKNVTKEAILQGWQKGAAVMAESEGFKRIATGQITVDHYRAILRQIWFQVRETPQLQGLASSHFFGPYSGILATFLRHAMTEVGHDDWILDDLKVLGEDVEALKNERPLPATQALLSFPYHQLHHRNIWGYMGYIFHFEHTSTVNGDAYMNVLKSVGVPATAFTFLQGHIEIDVMHNKMMEKYIDLCLLSEANVNELIWGTQMTAALYGNLITEAIRDGDRRIAEREAAAKVAA